MIAMTFWIRVQSHDRGAIGEPPTLHDAVQGLVKVFAKIPTEEQTDAPLSRGPVRVSVSSNGSLRLLIPYETEMDGLVEGLELVLASLLSDWFDPDDCWARHRFCDSNLRAEAFRALKSVVPPVNADFYLDYVRPIDRSEAGETRGLVFPLGSRLVERARQAFVPDMDMETAEGEQPSELLEFDRIAWCGTVLEPTAGRWRFRVRKEEDGDDPEWFVEDEIIGRFAHARTRMELEELARENLCFLWTNYAYEPDDRLTPDAQSLKEYLRKRLKEV